jgi:two-component system response regulator MprA
VRVLVVEDDLKLADLLVRALTEEAFEVIVAHNGNDAIAAIEAQSPGIVVLDWMIPEPDGLEVCRRVRRAGFGAPIILLTARGELEDRVRGLDTGADDYLVKPFEIDELLARLRALQRRAEGGAQAAVGPLRLSFAERAAYENDRRLELTAREFDLLACFVRHTDQVLSKSDLLQRVWRIDFDPGTNLVEVHISRLRSKLGGVAPLLETVRGGGYRLRSADA